jgi:hypothetical protein
VNPRAPAPLSPAPRLSSPSSPPPPLLWIPRPLRDAAYRLVAAIRHRVAGRSNACEIPPPELRGKLI